MSLRFLSAAFFVAAAVAMLGARARPPRVVDIHIFGINDFHGALESPTGGNGRIGNAADGGAAYLATHLKRDIAAHPNSNRCDDSAAPSSQSSASSRPPSDRS